MNRSAFEILSISSEILASKILFDGSLLMFNILLYFSVYSREYPCDHYTSVITVTMVISGCPRLNIQATALQLLQILDKRFFGSVGLLQGEKEKG